MRNATLEIFGPDYLEDYVGESEPHEPLDEPTRPSMSRRNEIGLGQSLGQTRGGEASGIHELDVQYSRW